MFIHAAWHRVAVAGLTSVLCAGGVAWAAPDFSKSEILTSSESPLEGDVVTFTLVLRNSGPDDAGAVSLSVEWPLMGFLIDADGFDGAQIDHEARQITNDFPSRRAGSAASSSASWRHEIPAATPSSWPPAPRTTPATRCTGSAAP